MATGQTRNIAGIAPRKTAISGRIPTGTTIGEIFSNLPDQKLWGYDGSIVFEYGAKSFLGLTGGTITGNTRVTGSLSAGTILSGSTDLYSIFATIPDQNDVTRVQPGSNITTGGTANLPTVNLVASPSLNNITFSGTAIGGTGQFAAVTATSLSAGTLSGGTILSGSTNLYSIFQAQTGVLKQKNGSVTGSTFSGNPKKAIITFTTAFPDNNYAVTITGEIDRTWTIESKTSAGFTINANANLQFNSSNVFWMAGQIGESN
jgi:hypothetical protein